MADDEAEPPKTIAEPRFAPDLAPEIPLRTVENPPSEIEAAEAKSETDSEMTGEQPAEAGPSAAVSSGPRAQSKKTNPVGSYDSVDAHRRSDSYVLVDSHDPAVAPAPADTHIALGTPDLAAHDPGVADGPMDEEEPDDEEESMDDDGPSDEDEWEPAPGLAPSVPETAPTHAAEPPLYSPGAALTQSKPRSQFLSLAATALVGGILGVGGAFAVHHYSPAIEEHFAELAKRLDAIEGRGGTASSAALAALETRVAAAESAANKAAEIANKAAETASKAAETANSAEGDLQKDIASRPAPVAELKPSPAQEAPDLGPLNARMDAIEQKITSLESTLAAFKDEIHANRQQDRETTAAAPVPRAQAIAIVAESLLRKFDGDRPFSAELTALENLGVPADTLAPLRVMSTSPESSERQLTEQFASLAPAIVASAKQESPDEGFLDRVTRHAKELVHLRRVGKGKDMDAESLVDQIEKALADHDLETAYAAWSDLPSTAMQLSESWGNAAKARLDALTAARSIEAESVATLGKPKS